MGHKNAIPCIIVFLFVIILPYYSIAQDTVYLKNGRAIDGKVFEVNKREVKMYRKVLPDRPVYTFNTTDVDSIIYFNGTHDDMSAFGNGRNLKENIPQLNTWAFDVVGFLFCSASQSYERRLKNGVVGLRVPLYIGYYGGSVAGEGVFQPKYGVSAPYGRKTENSIGFNNYNNSPAGRGIGVATGLNTKFYLFKRRVVRAFIGPEATIGYTRVYLPDYNYPLIANRNGTAAALAKLGLSINPVDKFNFTIDGGAGIGDVFGGIQPLGLIGLWHVGFALGTNF